MWLGGVATTGVASPASVSLSLWYFLQTSPDPTSCHDRVVPRVLPLDLRGLLKAQMVKSVIRQVLQGGCRSRLEPGEVEG